MSTSQQSTASDVEVLSPGALQAIQSAEIDVQITTALKHPRSMVKFERRVRELAMYNADIAAQCSYLLQRNDNTQEGGKKNIVGPSARFAEIVATSFGNCRSGARVVGEDENFVTAQGVFHDLESNSLVTFEVRRSIRGKYGRYKPDMIAVTANAACSIALRNAVFKGVPKALWADLWEESRRVAKGDEKTLERRRFNMLAKFRDELGVTPEEIYAYLGIKGAADVDTDRLIQLGQIMVSITDGDTTADAVFRSPETPPEKPAATVKDKMDDIAGKAAQAPAGSAQTVEPAAAEQKAAPARSKAKAKPAPAPEPEKPAAPSVSGDPSEITAGQIASQILFAKTRDQVLEALDLARSLKNADERAMVEKSGEMRLAQLAKPAQAEPAKPAARDTASAFGFSDER